MSELVNWNVFRYAADYLHLGGMVYYIYIYIYTYISNYVYKEFQQSFVKLSSRMLTKNEHKRAKKASRASLEPLERVPKS